MEIAGEGVVALGWYNQLRCNPTPAPGISPATTETIMSRPDSEHVTNLKTFRDRLIAARRSAVIDQNLDTAREKFVAIQTALALVDTAIGEEQDLTPLPKVDDPTAPEPKL